LIIGADDTQLYTVAEGMDTDIGNRARYGDASAAAQEDRMKRVYGILFSALVAFATATARADVCPSLAPSETFSFLTDPVALTVGAQPEYPEFFSVIDATFLRVRELADPASGFASTHSLGGVAGVGLTRPIDLDGGAEGDGAVFVSRANGSVQRVDFTCGASSCSFAGSAAWTEDATRPGCNDTIRVAPVLHRSIDGTPAFQSAYAGKDLVYAATHYSPTGGGTCGGDQEDNQVIAWDAATGSLEWRFNSGAPFDLDDIRGLVLDVEADTLYATAERTLSTTQDSVWAIDVLTGTRAWSANAGRLWSEAVLSGDRLYAANIGGEIKALARTDGSEIWSLGGGAPFTEPMVRAGSRLAVVDLLGRLWIARDDGGSAVWEHTVTLPLGDPIDPLAPNDPPQVAITSDLLVDATGKLLVGADDGIVYEIDPETGAVGNPRVVDATGADVVVMALGLAGDELVAMTAGNGDSATFCADTPAAIAVPSLTAPGLAALALLLIAGAAWVSGHGRPGHRAGRVRRMRCSPSGASWRSARCRCLGAALAFSVFFGATGARADTCPTLDPAVAGSSPVSLPNALAVSPVPGYDDFLILDGTSLRVRSIDDPISGPSHSASLSGVTGVGLTGIVDIDGTGGAGTGAAFLNRENASVQRWDFTDCLFSAETGGSATWTRNLARTGCDDTLSIAPELHLYHDASPAYQATYSVGQSLVYVGTNYSPVGGSGCSGEDEDNKIYALDASDGSIVWTFNNGLTEDVDEVRGLVLDIEADILFVTTERTLVQDSVWAIDVLNSGSDLWSANAGRIWSAPILAGDRLYVVNLSGELKALDKTDGSTLWSVGTVPAYPFLTTPVQAGNRIAAVDFLGHVRIFRDDGGSAVLEHSLALPNGGPPGPFPDPPAVAVTTPPLVDASGTLLVGAEDGNVYEIDPATGVIGDVRVVSPSGADVTQVTLTRVPNEMIAISGGDDLAVFCADTPEEHLIDATGDGGGAVLDGPWDVVTDDAGNVFVSGNLSNNVFRIAPGGAVTEILDATGDGLGNPLEGPRRLATDAAGNLYVAGFVSQNVFKVTPGGAVTEILDSAGAGGELLGAPRDLATDAAGNVFVAGAGGPANAVFEVEPGGAVSVILDGAGGDGYALLGPLSVATDGAGNVFVGDTVGTVFRIAPGGATAVILDATGDGTSTFSWAAALATDPSGNVFAAGRNSDNVFRVAPGGAITEVIDAAGSPHFGSGLEEPQGLATDGFGNVFVSSEGPSDDAIFGAKPDGTVLDLDETESSFFGSVAGPRGLTVDAAGNLYVAGYDSDNVVRVALCGGPLNGGDAPFCPAGGEPPAVPALGPGGVLVLVSGIVMAAALRVRRPRRME